MSNENVQIEITKDEALVLFEFLSRFSETTTLEIGEAERDGRRKGTLVTYVTCPIACGLRTFAPAGHLPTSSRNRPSFLPLSPPLVNELSLNEKGTGCTPVPSDFQMASPRRITSFSPPPQRAPSPPPAALRRRRSLRRCCPGHCYSAGSAAVSSTYPPVRRGGPRW